MNTRKPEFEAEYLVFAGKWRPLLMLLLLAVVCVINFFIAGVFWELAVLTAPVLCMAVLCFMDFFVFSGFNSRKSIGMELLKSSSRGKELIAAALKQDLVNKALYTLAGSTVCLISVFMFNPEVDKPFVIFYAISGYASSQILLRLTLLLDRSKGLTMQTHILICYLFYSIGTIIMLPLIFVSEKLSLPLIIGYAIIAEAGSVLTGILLIRSCMKTYDCSFHDASNSD